MFSRAPLSRIRKYFTNPVLDSFIERVIWTRTFEKVRLRIATLKLNHQQVIGISQNRVRSPRTDFLDKSIVDWTNYSIQFPTNLEAQRHQKEITGSDAIRIEGFGTRFRCPLNVVTC